MFVALYLTAPVFFCFFLAVSFSLCPAFLISWEVCSRLLANVILTLGPPVLCLVSVSEIISFVAEAVASQGSLAILWFCTVAIDDCNSTPSCFHRYV